MRGHGEESPAHGVSSVLVPSENQQFQHGHCWEGCRHCVNIPSVDTNVNLAMSHAQSLHAQPPTCGNLIQDQTCLYTKNDSSQLCHLEVYFISCAQDTHYP